MSIPGGAAPENTLMTNNPNELTIYDIAAARAGVNRPLATVVTEVAAAEARARRVAYRTRGHSHGPITRLVSPSDVGKLIKPFVFLDYFDIDPKHMPAIGFHPHSGIATLTLLLEGQVSYEETSGTKGVIEPGGVEWMRAAGGVWHTGGTVGTARAMGYQLWVALPPEMESIESEAQYLGGEHFQSQGPARVILGRHGAAASKVAAPPPINYLDVALKKGEKWRYEPPENHTVAWVAVHRGKLAAPEIVDTGELVVFEESNRALEFEALEGTGFVLGTAVKHPHELVLGTYSVHTSRDALARGEAKIAEIGKRLRAEGRL
jgi:redox-sensitive bicupin YhaK (pirin superfamily)